MATNHNILYIGIDYNGNIKIGSTQQTVSARMSGADFLIHHYYDAGKETLSRSILYAFEGYLRYRFTLTYPQITTDRFEMTNNDYFDLFEEVIEHLKNKYGVPFGEKQKYF